MSHLTLDGRSLTLADLEPFLRGEDVQLRLSPEARNRVVEARDVVERAVLANEVVYGLTTGFGKLRNVAIANEDLGALQHNLIVSHCCGVGEALDEHVVRLVQLLRINMLARGHSGVRIELVDWLIDAFEKRFVPRVPSRGSVGASGDLAPLAHMAAAYLGEGEALVDGRRVPAAEGLRSAGLEPLVLTAKEGLALINGTEVMLALGLDAFSRACNVSRAMDAAAALSIEALFGSLKPFDARIAELKGHAGHAAAAANVRACLADSAVLASHADCDRVQDPYSLRCVPQVHGAVKSALAHIAEVLSHELNSVTDNPLIFPDTDEVISAGQFHGQPIAMALDYLSIALATVANISERRVEQLVNPDLSRLPAFLTPKPGLNSGLMIAQVAAAALASENKSLAHPASVDTIPTSANQEDHVSMGVTAAHKARAIVGNVERVLAIEILCGAQAREFHREFEAGVGARALFETVRTRVTPLEADRYLATDIEAVLELLTSEALVGAVEAVVGDLAAF
ncbi:MAG: histidine ammonia-lyase [Planctomycetota bacterium]